MALLPVQATVIGDFVIHLVAIDDEEPMSEVAAKIAHHSIGRRVFPTESPLRVRFKGELLPDDATAASAGVGPMDVLYAVTQP